MARTAFAERPTSLKVLGVAFVALMAFFIWLTFAFFNKTFVNYDNVTLTGDKAGLNIPDNADIKLRGMIVGEVRKIEATPEGAKITLGMNPDMIDQVPANVTAEIIPKTLFGEKYISLVAPAEPSSEHLKAGDTITRAKVPIEVETLLNDLYPLLKSIDPAKLSYTLSAVSQALDGRGEKFGKTLVKLNDYLQTLNPDVPQLVTDLVQLGDVSDGYADAMPQIGRTLENTVTTGNTIVAKRAQLAAFFDEGTSLADTLTTFFKANGSNMEALAKQSRAALEIEAKYSSTFPCFLNGLRYLTPRASSVLRNRTVHIDLEVVPDQPTAYKPDENAKLPSQAVLDSIPAADPKRNKRFANGGPDGLAAVCEDLKKYEGNLKTDPWSQSNPFPTFPASVYQLIGINNDHNGKFGKFKGNPYYPRAAASSLVDPSLDSVDNAQQRELLAELAGAVAGKPASEMPDVASIMLSPVIRGAEVSIR